MTRSGPVTDRDMMRLVAELYYIRELRQPEIAELTGFSISKVSRLLSQARDAGVVRIWVEPASEERPALEAELEQRFGIEVVITPGRESDPAAAARLCGVAAADAVVRALPGSGTVGVAAGYTVGAMASALPLLSLPGLTIMPVVGGVDAQLEFLDGTQLTRRIAERLGATPLFLHAPAVLDTPEMKDALLLDSAISATTVRWASLDLAVVGIGGGPEAHPGYRTVVDRMGDSVRHELASMDVVGDLAGHFFRQHGAFAEEPWDRRIIAIPIEDLRRVPKVIAIAAGAPKAAAILGALRTRAVDVLITDRPTGEAVLRLAASSRGFVPPAGRG
jgi:DNA-binding transcriptional regulator LsrR (DeoR family)